MTAAWDPQLRQAEVSLRPPGCTCRPGLSPSAAIDIAILEFGVSRDDLLSHRRRRDLLEARAFVAWALRSLGRPLSYPEIGWKLGDRDHSTIVNLHQKAIALRLRDAEFNAKCQRLAQCWLSMKEASQ